MIDAGTLLKGDPYPDFTCFWNAEGNHRLAFSARPLTECFLGRIFLKRNTRVIDQIGSDQLSFSPS